MAVVFSCPSWCVDHREPIPEDAGDGGVHYGAELAVDLEDIPESEPARRIWTQVVAHDRGRRRHSTIGLVDPNGLTVEMTGVEARQVAQILMVGADLRLAPADGDCPAWCLGHGQLDRETDAAGVRHRGPFMVVRQPDAFASGLAIAVRVTALDSDGERQVCLEMIVQAIATELTGGDACRIAAQLLNSADQIDGG
ncbi:DUF6907 domain-containing protein [Nocardia bovistercoris]|uniref:Uncharacterized protein n=1 Tax=Nocardia bovistercoris TaxID=2785916 RepID=A0A931I8T9_9NOCA|nr:hypothetical protein [Nocardia bovistercoris]MBH0775488.1 hypothetical protein [Nocardia bovistercoris]